MDNENEASSSGGFGKDYHGQDVFGERAGSSGIGGDGHESSFDAPEIDTTELSNTESSFEGEAETQDALKDSVRSINEEVAEENSNTGSMDTSFQIGGTEDDAKKDEKEKNWASNLGKAANKVKDTVKDIAEKAASGELLDTLSNAANDALDTSYKAVAAPMEDLNKKDASFPDTPTDNSDWEKATSSFDVERAKEKEKETAVEKAKKDEEAANKAVEKALSLEDKIKQNAAKLAEKRKNEYIFSKDRSVLENLKSTLRGLTGNYIDSELKELAKDTESLAKALGIDVGDVSGIKTLGDTKALNKLDKLIKIHENLGKAAAERVAAAKANQQKAQNATKEAKGNLDKYNSSFTDKVEESKEEAKVGPNMSKASVGESDYLTKANKDSTKKESPSRNDFGNHAVDTLKGVADRIADNTTAKALRLKSVEEFAKENGYDPDKLSTMKAYQIYQNKQIMKALPSIVKKVGSYITERIKDAVDPSQLPERIRNTLARYNAATLVGAAILSIQSGAGIQASIDQALTMVDPEDQPDVSDYLEGVLNDEGTVADLSNAFDDALAPEQSSDTAELDESIVNIGRKDNTDYSDFNAGLGTTSDADVKVFIARNVKADPILRRMISKMGK